VDFLDPEDLPSEQQTGGKVKIQLADMDLARLGNMFCGPISKSSRRLLAEMEKVSPADDAKLQHLKHQILDKIAAPINPGNRKVLLFTAFADTADYLYEHLSPMLRQQRTQHRPRRRLRPAQVHAWPKDRLSGTAHALLAAIQREGSADARRAG
jgi:hypothetical protein